MPRSSAVVLLAICFLLPATSNASPYLLSTDYSGINGLPSGRTVAGNLRFLPSGCPDPVFPVPREMWR